MPPDTFFPPLPEGSGDRPTFNFREFDDLLKYRAFQQQAVVYVAAPDTPSDLAYMAKYKCDGTADDVEIQQAIASLPAQGGEVVLLVGTYLTDTAITIPDNVVVRGQGPGTVVRKVTDAGGGTTDGVFENSDSVSGNSNLIIRDMSIYAGTGVDTSAIFWDNVTIGLIAGITAIEAGDGVNFAGREAVRAQNCDRVLIENSELGGFSDSVRFGGFSTGTPTIDSVIQNCQIYGAGNDAVTMSSDSQRIRIMNNRMDQPGSNAIEVNGSECLVSGNVVVDGGIDGIDVAGSSNLIVDNTILVTLAGYTTHGIDVGGNGNVIRGNSIIGQTPSICPDTGIEVGGGYNIVSNNNISTVLFDAIDAAAGTEIQILGNAIYDFGVASSGEHAGIRTSSFNTIIANNRITQQTDNGATLNGIEVVSGADYSQVVGNNIICNALSNEIDIGVSVEAADVVLVSDNAIANCLSYGVAAGRLASLTENVSVESNQIVFIRSIGIIFGSNAFRAKAHGNQVYDSAAYGIQLSGDFSAAVDNHIYSPGTTGVFIDGADTMCNNNHVYDSTDYGIYVASTALRAQVNSNRVRNNGFYAYWIRGDDVQLVGNYSYNSTGDAIRIEGERCHCVGNNVDDSQARGIIAFGSGSTIVNDNRIYNPATDGIYFDVPYGQCNNNHIELAGSEGIYLPGANSRTQCNGNTIKDSSGPGIFMNGGDNNQINDNNIFNTGAYGIQIIGSNYTQVANNRIEEADYHGIAVTSASDSLTINGNYVSRCSQFSLGTYDGIFLANSSGMNHCSIINNVVKGSADHRYGIRLDGSNVNNCLVSNNELVFSGSTGAYSDLGTGTDILGGNRT